MPKVSVEVEVRPVKICRAYHFFKEHTNTGILDHKILSWHAVSLGLVITGIWKLSMNYEKTAKDDYCSSTTPSSTEAASTL